VEPILLEHDGRPHWGKFHGASGEVLASRYPDWQRFQAVRQRLDPGGTFLNDHLASIFGP
jgi:L-gulonolactone oxidase